MSQNCFIWVFLGWNSKKLGFFYISTLKLFQTKFCPKIKILKFGTKIALIGYLGILDWNFKNLMSNLKSASSNLLTCKNSSKNKKFLNLGAKIPYLGIFGPQFNKNYYQIFNQHTRICETIKFHPKRKDLGPKNALFASLAEILKNHYHISN